MADPVIVRLRHPVVFGSETIEELKLRPTARSMKDFTIQMKGNDSVIFEPYAAAKVGVHMAGHSNAVLDLLHPVDVMTIATKVMDFFDAGPATGLTLSASSEPRSPSPGPSSGT
jgi:hypothetical protein